MEQWSPKGFRDPLLARAADKRGFSAVMKWLADENFRNAILRGIARKQPDFDVLRVQDLQQIAGSNSERVLDWTLQNDRVLLTHDSSTMLPALRWHYENSMRLPKTLPISEAHPISGCIEEALLPDQASTPEDRAAGVSYRPQRWAPLPRPIRPNISRQPRPLHIPQGLIQAHRTAILRRHRQRRILTSQLTKLS